MAGAAISAADLFKKLRRDILFIIISPYFMAF
jgi:hypothetical protein